MPRVSVLMPARNAADHIAEALESVAGQDMKDLDVVVVDDGSTDDTADLADSFRGVTVRVVSTDGTGRGVAAALNTGLRIIDAEFVARFDADDVMLPGRLSTQVRVLDGDPHVTAVAGGHISVSGKGHRLLHQGIRGPLHGPELPWVLALGNCIVHPTVLVRRSAPDLGYPVGQPFEDYALWLGTAHTWRWRVLDEPCIKWRVSAGSQSKRARTDGVPAIAPLIAAHWSALGVPLPLECAAAIALPTADVDLIGRTEERILDLRRCAEAAVGSSSLLRALDTAHAQWRARALRVLAARTLAVRNWPAAVSLRPPGGWSPLAGTLGRSAINSAAMRVGL